MCGSILPACSPDRKSLNGAQDLKQVLKGQTEKFIRNVTEKLLTYALGRGLERHDGPTVDQTRCGACRLANQ